MGSQVIAISLVLLSLAAPAWAEETELTGREPAEKYEASPAGAQEPDAPAQEEDPKEDSIFDEVEEADIERSVGIEEILITSERRQASLQDVPVSASVFSAQEILNQGIQNIKGIADYTPNLEIRTAFAASNPTLFIRGVGLNDYNPNAAGSVAVYQDEVYMNSPAIQLLQFFDVQGVDVLRGPQGSLYGRNASAGAIRITSVEPTQEFDLTAFATYGRFNDFELETAIGGAIVEDLISARLSIHYRRRDGTAKNHCTFLETPNTVEGTYPREAGWCGGRSTVRDDGILSLNSNRAKPTIPAGLPARVNDVHNWAARAQIRVTPGVLDMDWLFNLHGGMNLSQGVSFYHASDRIRSSAPGIFQDRRGYPTPGFASNDNPYEGHYSRVGDEALDTLGAFARGTMQFRDDLSFVTLTAYESAKRVGGDDFDSSPLGANHNDFRDDSWQVSQELRLDWQQSDDLEIILGGMYLHANLSVDNTSFTDLIRDPTYPLLEGGASRTFEQDYSQDTDAFSLYAHAKRNFLADFTIEGGVRYSWERKDFEISTIKRLRSSFCPADTPGCADVPPEAEPLVVPGRPVTAIEQDRMGNWTAVTGDIALSYRLTEDASVYGKYSRGWKPGGFNGSALIGGVQCDPDICPLIDPIDAESVSGIEMGLKSYWLDRRLTVNAAFFLQEYEDLQVFLLENTSSSLIPRPTLINANNAVIYGVELELYARPLPGLDIRTQFGWLEGTYNDFFQVFFVQAGSRPGRPGAVQQQVSDYSGNRLAASPRFSWSGIASHQLWLPGDKGTLTPSFTWRFKSLTYFDMTEGRDRRGQANHRSAISSNTFLGQPAFWTFDVSLAYTVASERLQVTAWVRNLADTTTTVDAFSSLEGEGSVQRVIDEPRTFGLSLWFAY